MKRPLVYPNEICKLLCLILVFILFIAVIYIFITYGILIGFFALITWIALSTEITDYAMKSTW